MAASTLVGEGPEVETHGFTDTAGKTPSTPHSSHQGLNTLLTSQEEIKRIGGVSILLINQQGRKGLLTWLTYLALVFQSIYFVNTHFLQASNYYISC